MSPLAILQQQPCKIFIRMMQKGDNAFNSNLV